MSISSNESFKQSLTHDEPPAGCSSLLMALWHDGKGDWDQAHDIAQNIHDQNGSLVHAYLHRKEGDLWNAKYWYHRAGEELPEETLENEWERLVTRFL